MSEQEKRQLNSSTEGIDTQNIVEILMTVAIFETSSEKQVTKSCMNKLTEKYGSTHLLHYLSHLSHVVTKND